MNFAECLQPKLGKTANPTLNSACEWQYRFDNHGLNIADFIAVLTLALSGGQQTPRSGILLLLVRDEQLVRTARTSAIQLDHRKARTESVVASIRNADKFARPVLKTILPTLVRRKS